MKILLLKDDTLVTTNKAWVPSQGAIIPPKGHRLCTVDKNNLGRGKPCAVKDGDTRYTYICKDGREAVDLSKIKMTNEAALLLYSETMPDKIKKSLLSEIGRKGGQAKSEKKSLSSAENGKRGGRPKKAN